MLPATNADRLLAAGTLFAALALVVLTATNWETIRGAPGPEHTALVADAVDEPAEAPAAPSAPAAEPPRPAVERPRPAPAAPVVEPTELAVTAVGGESWLEVRAGGPAGEQLYYGVLAAGETSTFDDLPVWVRVGALDNLELRLGDAPVASVPAAQGGVAEFVASADGLAPVGG